MHQDEIPPGTLYLLILKALARHGELHGFEIARMNRAGFGRSSQGRRGLALPRASAHVD
jgi:hypothetical protein